MIGQIRPLESRITRDRLKTLPSIPHIRIQLKESKDVQQSIRDVLRVPRKTLKAPDDDGPKMSKKCRLPDLVDRQKERLRIKFGIEIRKEELDKKKKEMKWMNEVIVKSEQSVNKKYFEFEVMCRNKTDAASKALLEAEHWERKRTKLSRPICVLDKTIKKIRSEITEQESIFERLSEYKNFIILFVHNFTNTIQRPITLDHFYKLPNQSEIINSMSLQSLDNGTFAIKEHRILNKTSEFDVFDEFSPIAIENELQEMETKSLRLIENWQLSADELHEAMLTQYNVIEKLNKQITDIKGQINMYRAEVKRCTERSKELELYCGMFVEGVDNGLFTGDETLKEYQRKITRIYNQVTENTTMNIEVETLTMLIAVETRLMDLIMEEEQLDTTKVLYAQREIERRRKTELYEQKNKEAEYSRLARNQRALERSRNPTQKTKTGRRLIRRSKPPSQTKLITNSSKEFVENKADTEEESFYFM